MPSLDIHIKSTDYYDSKDNHKMNESKIEKQVEINEEALAHIYEYIDREAPPKIAPVSGVLESSNLKSVIKPVAFKPCVRSTVLFNHSNLHESSSSKSGISSLSEPPYSCESESDNSFKVMIPPPQRTETIPKSNLSQSQGNLSQCSVSPLQDERWFLESPVSKLESMSSDLSSCFQESRKQAIYNNSNDFVTQTPSPSDSGVVELEAMLREKDSEINYLRETLEQNEQVIFKVYEEKNQSWEKEYKNLRLQYENNLKNYYQKLSQVEHSIAVQRQQKESEKKNWESEMEQLKKRGDSLQVENINLKNDLAVMETFLKDSQWSLWEKKGELTLLKSQLKDLIADQNYKASELANLKMQLKDCKTELEESIEKNKQLQSKLKSFEEKNSSEIENVTNQLSDTLNKLELKSILVEKLKKEKINVEYELGNVKEKLNLIEQGFKEEREQWKEEKERVIKYQRQLQINYKKMFQTNKLLENEFYNLTLILRNHCYPDDVNQSPD